MPCQSQLAMIGLTLGCAGFASTTISSPAFAADTAADNVADDIAALRAAQQRESAGDVIGAAMVLERALAAYPDAVESRTYYAALLCRLGNFEGARIETAKLDGTRPNPATWARVTQMCGPIPHPRRYAVDSGITGEISAGVAYDQDALGVLAVQFTVPGFIGPVAEAISVTAAAKLNGKTGIGSGYAYGGAALRTKFELTGPDSDYQLGEVTGGFGYGPISGGGVARRGWIIGDEFVSEYGGQAALTLPLSTRAAVMLRGEAVRQRHGNPAVRAVRDGDRYDVSIAADAQTAGGTSLSIGAAYEYKTARVGSEAYRGARGYAGLRVPLDSRDRYAGFSATYRYARFGATPGVSSRNDRRILARASVGTPIARSPLMAEAVISYTRRSFDRPSLLRSFSSAGAEVRLLWRF